MRRRDVRPHTTGGLPCIGIAFKHGQHPGATLATGVSDLGAGYQRKASSAPLSVGRSCHSMPREAVVVGKAAR